jgi:hypothetical protein
MESTWGCFWFSTHRRPVCMDDCLECTALIFCLQQCSQTGSFLRIPLLSCPVRNPSVASPSPKPCHPSPVSVSATQDWMRLRAPSHDTFNLDVVEAAFKGADVKFIDVPGPLPGSTKLLCVLDEVRLGLEFVCLGCQTVSLL